MNLDTADPQELLRQQVWLRRLVQHLVRSADVDDVVQETWLAALRRRCHLDRSWFAAVARNLAHLRLRRGERRQRFELAARSHDHAPATVDAVQRLDALRRVATAVCELPEPYRATIVARFLEDRSVAELAAASGVTPAAIRQRQKRGLDLLRQRLAGTYGDLRADRALGSLAAWGLPRRGPSIAAACCAGALGLPLLGALGFLAMPAPSARPSLPAPSGDEAAMAPAAASHVASATLQRIAVAVPTAAAPEGQDPAAGSPTWQLEVTIVDAQGAPVPRAIVRHARQDHWCDADGVARFTIQGDTVDGLLSARHGGACPRYGRAELRSRLPAAGGPVRLRLALESTRTIRGTANWSDGTPATGAIVFLRRSEALDPASLGRAPMQPLEDLATDLECEVLDGERTCETYLFAKADADGRFELKGLRARDYDLRILDHRSGASADRDAVAAGSADVQFVLARPERHHVRGRVRDAAGAPVDGAEVVALLPLLRVGSVDDAMVVARATSGADGCFELADVPVTATAIGCRGPAWLPLDVPLHGDQIVLTAEPRCGLVLQLHGSEARAVRFRVLDAQEHTLPIFGPDGSPWPPLPERTLQHGGGEECFVAPAAAMLQLLDGEGRELRRLPLALRAAATVRVQ